MVRCRLPRRHPVHDRLVSVPGVDDAVEHSNSQFEIDSLCESIRFVKKDRPFDSLVVMQFFLLIYCIVSGKKNCLQCFDAVGWATEWLGGRKGIRPVENFELWGTGMVICLERDADLHMAQLMPLTVFCFSKIQIGFTFLVPAHPGCPEKRAVKRMCVCLSQKK